jgi:hypothetical protein
MVLKKVFKVDWVGIVVDVPNIDDKALVLVIFFHVARMLACSHVCKNRYRRGDFQTRALMLFWLK